MRAAYVRIGLVEGLLNTAPFVPEYVFQVGYKLDTGWIERVAAGLPELPEAMKTRFERDYALSPYDARALTASRELARYFETVAARLPGGAKLAANWVMGELTAALHKANLDIVESPIAADKLAGLLARIDDGTISGKMAKEVFDTMWESAGSSALSADTIIEQRGLKQISDESALERIVDEVLAANEGVVAEYRAGREKAFNSLVGKAMQATRGKANPAQVNGILKRKLGA